MKMKKSIITLALAFLVALSGNITKAQTLHGFVIANTLDEKIGSGCMNDLEQMEVEMCAIANSINYEADVITIYDEDFSYWNVDKVLRELRCGPNDIVFFYYSGHGGRAVNDKTRYPQMCLGHRDNEMMALHKVDENIAAKKPKFWIVMADCCNSVTPGMSPKGFELAEETRINANISQKYKDLFSNMTGSVIVCSSSEGETSTAYEYSTSAFTKCFLKNLSTMVSGNEKANWNTLLEKTKNATYQLAHHTPLYEVRSGATNTTTPSSGGGGISSQPSENFQSALMKLTAKNPDKMDRINRIDPFIAKYFSSSTARVEVYGRSFNTMVSRETSYDFLMRVATSRTLASVVVISEEKDANGKITYLKIHEIYKEY